MNDTKQLLQTIDNRIRKILKEGNSINKFVGIVVERIGDDWAKVKIAGNDTVFTFANHSLNYLNVGDSVYIEVINNDMNTGIITQRFSNLTIDEISSGKTRHTIQKCVFPVGYILFTLNEENPSFSFGGSWEQIAEGTFLMAASIKGGRDEYYIPPYPAGSEGGEAEHTLTAVELPEQKGAFQSRQANEVNILDTYNTPNNVFSFKPNGGNQWNTQLSGTVAATNKNALIEYNNGGKNKAHNNLPPYLAVYMWQRIS